jgi:hypothetical protein
MRNKVGVEKAPNLPLKKLQMSLMPADFAENAVRQYFPSKLTKSKTNDIIFSSSVPCIFFAKIVHYRQNRKWKPWTSGCL